MDDSTATTVVVLQIQLVLQVSVSAKLLNSNGFLSKNKFVASIH